MKKAVYGLMLYACLVVPLVGSDTIKAEPDNPEKPILIQATTLRSFPEGIRTDTNEDGQIDYIVFFDEDGYRSGEELDYNHDGFMDDFYFYARDVLIRREIDSNYDRRIDIWVYIAEGVYVERYERDTDFDGEVDKVKEYGAGS